MNVYRVTYYTAGDSVACVNIEAATEADAIEYARQQDDLFAQIKSVKIGDKNDMQTPQIPPLNGSTPLGMSPKPAQAAAAPAKVTATEIMEELKKINADIEKINAGIDALYNRMENDNARTEELITAVNTMRDGIQHAATATPPAQGKKAETAEFICTHIERETRKNKNYYRAFGPGFHKFGVTIWDEVFELIGLDLKTMTWQEGYKYIFPAPTRLLGEVETYTEKESGEIKTGIKKVVGKA